MRANRKTKPNQKPENGKAPGRIYPKHTGFLTLNFGEAECGGSKYRLGVGIPAHQPIVMSIHPGKKFTLNWTEILDMAIAAGIDLQEGK